MIPVRRRRSEEPQGEPPNTGDLWFWDEDSEAWYADPDPEVDYHAAALWRYRKRYAPQPPKPALPGLCPALDDPDILNPLLAPVLARKYPACVRLSAPRGGVCWECMHEVPALWPQPKTEAEAMKERQEAARPEGTTVRRRGDDLQRIRGPQSGGGDRDRGTLPGAGDNTAAPE